MDTNRRVRKAQQKATKRAPSREKRAVLLLLSLPLPFAIANTNVQTVGSFAHAPMRSNFTPLYTRFSIGMVWVVDLRDGAHLFAPTTVTATVRSGGRYMSMLLRFNKAVGRYRQGQTGKFQDPSVLGFENATLGVLDITFSSF
ncbi:hypothetical protein V6N12_051956 [Hibiscus sabdariffa]|uniref:Dirigent protein n=1 Tax=Hibiscus sabdariffa TaxID=183260 RepID=A0ABR2GGV3_9ROSI